MSLRALVEHLIEVVACKPMLHRKDLMRRYGVDDSTIDRWHGRGVLPEPTYLRGSNVPLWKPIDLALAEATKRPLILALKKLHVATKRK